MLLPNANADYAAGVAHKILRALEQPIDFEGQPLDVGGSIGIAHYPEHGTDSGSLLRDADIAMYAAKGSNGGFAVFDAKVRYAPAGAPLHAERAEARRGAE